MIKGKLLTKTGEPIAADYVKVEVTCWPVVKAIGPKATVLARVSVGDDGKFEYLFKTLEQMDYKCGKYG
jgi:hypothetical protein